MADAPCYLYRHFSEGGALLYVGISSDIVARTRTHLKCAHWFDQVFRTEVIKLPCRSDAEEAELKAIREEAPLYNKVHNANCVKHVACAFPSNHAVVTYIDLTDPQWLAKTMAAKGIGSTELARQSGIDLSTVKRIKAGTLSPRLLTVAPIANALGCHLRLVPWDDAA